MAELELSVVIPALNEERTIVHCVEKAKKAIAALGLPGEVVIADNGSTDRTRAVAEAAGARVVAVDGRGYGRALRGGFTAAKGRCLIMGDADGSYDFEQAPRYVEKLRSGCDFVVGNRFQGAYEPGAMPFLNRHLGTPVLTGVMNLLFRTGLGDVNCGMRGVTKAAFERMGLKADGMEFATEMIVKASLLGMRIAEVPCDLHKDLRDRPPHLRRWRDGWRHLRFMLLFSPTGTFIVPGAAFLAVGGLGLLGVTARDYFAPGALPWLGSRHILTSLLFWLTGTSVLGLGVVAQEADYQERFDGHNPISALLHRTFSLEKGLIIGVSLILAGLLALLYFPLSFYVHVFPMGAEAARLDCAVLAIASVLTGVQCAFASFALGLFYLRVK
ncbi:MAG: glycosyltransferase family 2 protein [Elusimicrobia bacterium]|nr:glycosyltransferase family 2 protein [Elusimicrobiota bacterium]